MALRRRGEGAVRGHALDLDVDFAVRAGDFAGDLQLARPFPQGLRLLRRALHAGAARLGTMLTAWPGRKEIRGRRAAERAADLHAVDALFRVADREPGVRREAVVRHAHVLHVVGHVRAALLLVAAEDQQHAVAQGDARLPDGAQREEAGDAAALVVVRAAAVEEAIADDPLVGRDGPVAALGHDVQVREDSEGLALRRAAKGHVPGVVFVVAGFKAEALRLFQGVVQGAGAGLAKGLAGRGSPSTLGMRTRPRRVSVISSS